jgi:2-polyprenyl-6-methoxyphenol hydroxylase-like FAD-dependent oxidoreductase
MNAAITSIPRPVLRRNASQVAEAEGVTLNFDAKVTNIDPNTGTVTFNKDGVEYTDTSDLVVIADGLHSVADDLIRALPDGEVDLRVEPLSYVTAMLVPGSHNLSLNHLHFWVNPDNEDSFAIGVPNADGSVAALLISRYSDIDKGAHPFENPTVARERLARDFPQLLELDPTLPDQLPTRDRGNLYYKSVSHFVLGERAVVVGDAGHAAPPWAGYGANTAIHVATYLVNALAENNGDIATTLAEYDTYYGTLSRLMKATIQEHGQFISGAVATNPHGRTSGSFASMLEQASQAVTDRRNLVIN